MKATYEVLVQTGGRYIDKYLRRFSDVGAGTRNASLAKASLQGQMM